MRQFVLLNMERTIKMIEYHYETQFYQLKTLNSFRLESTKCIIKIFIIFRVFRTSTCASESSRSLKADFDSKHIRVVFVRLNGIQALSIRSIFMLIKLIECDERRLVPFKSKTIQI